MTSTPRVRLVPWRTALIALLTVALVWWFLRSINLRQAWQAVLDAHGWWIAAAIVVTIQTYVLRACRWQVLLAPVGHVSFRRSFRATVMGFAGNLLLPARAGEFLRAYVIARGQRFNAASAFGTIVVERLLDLVTVLVLFAYGMLFSGIDVGPAVKAAGWLAAGLAVAGIVVLFVLAGHPERFGRLADRLSRRLPPQASKLVGQIVRTLAAGLAVMRSPAHLAKAMVWSIFLWVSIALGIILTSAAFGLSVSFVGSFLVLGYLTVGVTAPTPGAAGGFHLAYKLALAKLLPAAMEPTVVAAAVVLHLVSFVPVTLLGVVYMWQDGLTLGQVRDVRSEVQAGDTLVG